MNISIDELLFAVGITMTIIASLTLTINTTIYIIRKKKLTKQFDVEYGAEQRRSK